MSFLLCPFSSCYPLCSDCAMFKKMSAWLILPLCFHPRVYRVYLYKLRWLQEHWAQKPPGFTAAQATGPWDIIVDHMVTCWQQHLCLCTVGNCHQARQHPGDIPKVAPFLSILAFHCELALDTPVRSGCFFLNTKSQENNEGSPGLIVSPWLPKQLPECWSCLGGHP